MDELERVRHEAIRLLCVAQARDQLTLDDFEGRLERIKQAPNPATLEAIVADLQEDDGYHDIPAAATPLPAVVATAAYAPVAPAEFLRVTSVFASTKRAGSWTVPLEIQALVVLGELTLDLRDAVFDSDVLDIDVKVTLGSFTLIVPAGTQVENEIEETLSSSEHSTRSARGARPNGLLVRVRGRSLLASIEIKERYPTGMDPGKGGFWQRLLGSGTS